MVNSNKVLTVSYGTFSCTLEGFENSFDVMRSIAEYFRDLASDDRYFGAEPPKLDAETLMQLAQAKSQQAVQAKSYGDRVVLSPAVSNNIQTAETQTKPEPSLGEISETHVTTERENEISVSNAEPTQEIETPTAKLNISAKHEKEPELSITERLQRIRDAAKHEQPTIEEAFAEDEYIGDDDTLLDHQITENTVLEIDTSDSQDSIDIEEIVTQTVPEQVKPETTEPEKKNTNISISSTGPQVVREGRRIVIKPSLNTTDNKTNNQTSAPAPQPSNDVVSQDDKKTAQTEIKNENDLLSEINLDDFDGSDDSIFADLGQSDDISEIGDELSINDDAFEDELASALGEYDDTTEQDYIKEDDEDDNDIVVNETAQNEDLKQSQEPNIDESAEKDAKSVAPRRVERSEAKATKRPQNDTIDEGDVGRIVEKTDEQLAAPDQSRRRSALAQLRAAVAATLAERSLIGSKKTQDQAQDYKQDLSKAVRPTRPSAQGSDSRNTQDDRAKPPLRLVAEQRINVESEKKQTKQASYNSFDDYVTAVKAHSLGEKLEAAAAYLHHIEGLTEFTRPQLIQTLKNYDPAKFSREETLIHFSDLLRNGKLERGDDGLFHVTDGLEFGPQGRQVG